jgi:predicted Zn-dependent protease
VSRIRTERGRTRRRRAAGALLALATALLAAGCAPLTVQEERQLGAQMALEARSQFPLLRDAVVVGYVREIGEAILEAAGPQPFQYRFYVVDDDDINAFAAPAGYVYVHTGTILKARNVSELAGVIAHEVGHVALRHIARNYSRRRNTGLAYQLGVALANAFGGGAAAAGAQLGGQLAAMSYLNRFGRDAERESDAFAVEVLPRAGYDPRGMVSFFEMLLWEDQGPSAPAFLSSHPPTRERLARSRELVSALPPGGPLIVDDRGKLEIIQRRILLLTGRVAPPPAPASTEKPL